MSALLQAWRSQAKSYPLASLGLLLAVLGVAWLLLHGVLGAFADSAGGQLRYAVLGGLAGFAATALGALLAVVLRHVGERSEGVMLGFAAGMMLAASAFSLILPGLEAAREITGGQILAALVVVVGLGLGTLLMIGLDLFTPHSHPSGDYGPNVGRSHGTWLFVLAIILHNLPEGMAIGVGFARGDLSVGVPLTSAIAIQDIPEGLAVCLALRVIGLSLGRAVLVAAASGLMEPLGALVGYGMSNGAALAYPISLGLAAGAMIFVVSHEVIPETHRNGRQTSATLGVMAGFAVMMFLDTALG